MLWAYPYSVFNFEIEILDFRPRRHDAGEEFARMDGCSVMCRDYVMRGRFVRVGGFDLGFLAS